MRMNVKQNNWQLNALPQAYPITITGSIRTSNPSKSTMHYRPFRNIFLSELFTTATRKRCTPTIPNPAKTHPINPTLTTPAKPSTTHHSHRSPPPQSTTPQTPKQTSLTRTHDSRPPTSASAPSTPLASPAAQFRLPPNLPNTHPPSRSLHRTNPKTATHCPHAASQGATEAHKRAAKAAVNHGCGTRLVAPTFAGPARSRKALRVLLGRRERGCLPAWMGYDAVGEL